MDDSEGSDLEILEVNPVQESGTSPLDTDNNKSKPKPSLKSIRCPICLDTPETVAVASCGHVYCADCVFQALSSAPDCNAMNGKCSLCRKTVRYDQVIYLEFKKGQVSNEEKPM